MFQAVWKGTVLAESNQTVKVEGNQYFPPQSLRREFLTPSATASRCPWKGTASYYDVTVDGQVNKSAAWYYPHPSPAAAQIVGRQREVCGYRMRVQSVRFWIARTTPTMSRSASPLSRASR